MPSQKVSGLCCSGPHTGVCGNPFFLLKSQFQTYSSDPTLAAVGTQHQHKGVVSAFVGIGREQGLLGYWRGACSLSPSCVTLEE
eukprot:SAG22_NODE_19083_length_278_cov_0.837989_1_plen_83_part_01